MSDFIRDTSDGHVDPNRGGSDYVHVAIPSEISAEPADIGLPEEYRKCDGTWSEFVGDVKKFNSKVRNNFTETISDISESIGKVFHRKPSQEV